MPNHRNTASRLPTPWLDPPVFSQAVTTDAPLVFTAGHAAFDETGVLVGVGDIEAQLRQTYVNLSRALEEAGASLATVVRQTVYLVRREDTAVLRAVVRELFAPPLPAATAVRCDLVHPDMLVEIEAVAAVGVARS